MGLFSARQKHLIVKRHLADGALGGQESPRTHLNADRQTGICREMPRITTCWISVVAMLEWPAFSIAAMSMNDWPIPDGPISRLPLVALRSFDIQESIRKVCR